MRSAEGTGVVSMRWNANDTQPAAGPKSASTATSGIERDHEIADDDEEEEEEEEPGVEAEGGTAEEGLEEEAPGRAELGWEGGSEEGIEGGEVRL